METIFPAPVPIEGYDQQQESHDCFVKVDLIRFRRIQRSIELLDDKDQLDQECTDDRQRTEFNILRDKAALALMSVTQPHKDQRDVERQDRDRYECELNECKYQVSPADIHIPVNIFQHPASCLCSLSSFVFNRYRSKSSRILCLS